MEKRLVLVEKEMVLLKKENLVLKNDIAAIKAALKIKEEAANQLWETNIVTEWMIKLVYPGIYSQRLTPTAGFPQNRRKTAAQIRPGQMMFIYTTSPIKKIIGLTRVTSQMAVKEGRWPYSVDLEWVIGPKVDGVTLEEAGLLIRPRPGDTLYGINEDTAQDIISLLKTQPDLTSSQWDLLVRQFRDDYKEVVSFDIAVQRLREAQEYFAADELDSFAAADGTRRGWDEMVIKGLFHSKFPQARSIIWPTTYND